MFTLNPLPPQITASLVQKLVRAEPATIGHFRHWGFMDPGLRAMQQDVRIAGPAVTVHQHVQVVVVGDLAYVEHPASLCCPSPERPP